MIGVAHSDAAAPDGLVAALEAGHEPVTVGSPDTVIAEAPRVIAAIGMDTVGALARAGVDVPVLPIGAGPGLGSLSPDAPETAARLIADDFGTRRHPVLDIRVDGVSAGRALFDAMLVTTEPARISEYGLATENWDTRFRADGLVAATPAGSHHYATAAGGPLLSPASGVIAVVPVAVFAINASHWVFDLESPPTLTVERDEGEVVLLLDGRAARSVPAEDPVELVAADTLETVVVSPAPPA